MINGASESIVNFGEDFQFETDDHSAPIVNFDADLSWETLFLRQNKEYNASTDKGCFARSTEDSISTS